MKTLLDVARRIALVGGWVPLVVFAFHVLATQAFDLYVVWPDADMPMHFAGGVAMAFFVSQCFRTLPRESARRGRLAVLELVLVVSLTATAAVFWEFAEFGVDRLTGSNVQLSIENTMQDLALGILGACVFAAVRGRRLRAGPSDVRDVAMAWIEGRP
jgi:hypothetical protein